MVELSSASSIAVEMFSSSRSEELRAGAREDHQPNKSKAWTGDSAWPRLPTPDQHYQPAKLLMDSELPSRSSPEKRLFCFCVISAL
jgi:hypothetical protein